MVGTCIRMERIMNRRSGRTVIVPMDHGTSSGPIRGLENMRDAIGQVVRGGANAVVMHKGMVQASYQGVSGSGGLIVHLSAGTALSACPNTKVLVATVEEALQLGADAVSVHVNLGADAESDMLRDLGDVARACARWGMPLLAMMYTRGPHIESEYDVRHVKHAARTGAELGADIVKVNYSGSPETFREVVGGCPVPVVIAGGEQVETETDVLHMVVGALAAGAAGVSIGRNVFQHPDPEGMTRAICMLVHEGSSVEAAQEMLASRRRRSTVGAGRSAQPAARPAQMPSLPLPAEAGALRAPVPSR